jgi:uncharacterized protein YbbK (DUF523 family)
VKEKSPLCGAGFVRNRKNSSKAALYCGLIIRMRRAGFREVMDIK